jgi:hypothetical protein
MKLKKLRLPLAPPSGIVKFSEAPHALLEAKTQLADQWWSEILHSKVESGGQERDSSPLNAAPGGPISQRTGR